MHNNDQKSLVVLVVNLFTTNTFTCIRPRFDFSRLQSKFLIRGWMIFLKNKKNKFMLKLPM